MVPEPEPALVSGTVFVAVNTYAAVPSAATTARTRIHLRWNVPLLFIESPL
jgi:hypothetical protein